MQGVLTTMKYARSKLFALVLAAALPAGGINAVAAGDARLADAAMMRDTTAVRALLGQKVDVNAPGKDGTPALHWAVRVDDVATARLLLGAGADAKLANRYGVTPLFLACSNGNAEMIRLLLDAGADPNDTDPTGETRADDRRARRDARRREAARWPRCEHRREGPARFSRRR